MFEPFLISDQKIFAGKVMIYQKIIPFHHKNHKSLIEYAIRYLMDSYRPIAFDLVLIVSK